MSLFLCMSMKFKVCYLIIFCWLVQPYWLALLKLCCIVWVLCGSLCPVYYCYKTCKKHHFLCTREQPIPDTWREANVQSL